MQRVFVEKIKGFKVIGGGRVEILCSRKLPFYIKEFKGKLEFNLPIGIYYTNLPLIEIKPIKYDLPKLPKLERNIKKPKKLNLIFCVNPNKCSIDLPSGTIFLDNSFKNATRPQLEFVIGHEKAHYNFATEKHCDTLSAYNMIKKGYNPSQLTYSCNSCLSDHSETRKENIFNFSKKIHK